ncbi:MAG: hypothetical protein EOO89_18430 [Pedobacter sp.]|nr:MAG: hypothetical protein EOO89_18430 [Pedobacter sp.]
MKKQFDLKNIKYIPKIGATLGFFTLLFVQLFLFWGRKKTNLRVNYLIEQDPDFYHHVSNLTISCILYSGIGYMWVLLGVPFRFIYFLGGVILASNFVYELWIPVLNTPDLKDAWYGMAGTLMGFTFLLLVKKFGVRLSETVKQNVRKDEEVRRDGEVSKVRSSGNGRD